MLVIPGQLGKDVCDKSLAPTRRDLLRVGGSAMLGMGLGSMLGLQAMPAASAPEPGLKEVLRVAVDRQGEVSRPAKGPEIGDPEQCS